MIRGMEESTRYPEAYRRISYIITLHDLPAGGYLTTGARGPIDQTRQLRHPILRISLFHKSKAKQGNALSRLGLSVGTRLVGYNYPTVLRIQGVARENAVH